MKKIAISTMIIGMAMTLMTQSVHATINTLKICNKGSITAYVAVARYGIEETNVQGWFETKPGRCATVSQSRTYHHYLTFAVKGGYLNFLPTEISNAIQPGNEALCVSKKDGFSYLTGDMYKLLCKPGYELAPFWTHIYLNTPTRYYYGRENEFHQTIDIAPEKDSLIIKPEMVPRMMEARRDYVESVEKAAKAKHNRISRVVWDSLRNLDNKMLGNLMRDYQNNTANENMDDHTKKMKQARKDLSNTQEDRYVSNILKKLRGGTGEGNNYRPVESKGEPKDNGNEKIIFEF